MEIFDVFSMNGIENYPAASEIFLENVILKVSQTHFPRISTPRRGQGGHTFFKGGNAPLGGGGGGREVPCLEIITGKNAGRRPKIWSKIINFIALWDFQTG